MTETNNAILLPDIDQVDLNIYKHNDQLRPINKILLVLGGST